MTELSRLGYRLYADGDYLHIDDATGNTVAIPGVARPRLAEELLRGMDDLEIAAMLAGLRRTAPALAQMLGIGPAPELRHVLPAPGADVDALRELGRVWEKHGKQRVYFDPLQGWYGLHIERGPEGAIVAIRFRGQPITDREATPIIDHFREAKLWFDLADHSFHGKGLWQEDFEFIVEQILTLEEERCFD